MRVSPLHKPYDVVWRFDKPYLVIDVDDRGNILREEPAATRFVSDRIIGTRTIADWLEVEGWKRPE